MDDFEKDNIEYFIIKNIVSDPTFARKFVDKITPDLFSPSLGRVFNALQKFYNKYGKIPNSDILKKKVFPKLINDDETLKNTIKEYDKCSEIEYDESYADWLKDETKSFILTRRAMQATVDCVSFIESKDITKILPRFEEVFQIDFEENFGIEYFSDLEDRIERMKNKEPPIPTSLQSLNSRIGDGYYRKSLFVFAGPANTGKTLWLNNESIALALKGYNVLYLSLELAEDYIAARTDANFASISMDEVRTDPVTALNKAIARRDSLLTDGKKLGKLYYQEHGPGTITPNSISNIIKDLSSRKGVTIDIVAIDYLKLLRANTTAQKLSKYEEIGLICEQLRKIAMEFNIVVLTASQTGRQSYGQSHIGMEDVSDSIGISQTADVLVTLIKNEELDKESKMIIHIAKSRFSKGLSSFTVGIDYSHMKIFDLEGDVEIKSKNKELLSKLKTEKANYKTSDMDNEILNEVGKDFDVDIEDSGLGFITPKL